MEIILHRFGTEGQKKSKLFTEEADTWIEFVDAIRSASVVFKHQSWKTFIDQLLIFSLRLGLGVSCLAPWAIVVDIDLTSKTYTFWCLRYVHIRCFVYVEFIITDHLYSTQGGNAFIHICLLMGEGGTCPIHLVEGGGRGYPVCQVEGVESPGKPIPLHPPAKVTPSRGQSTRWPFLLDRLTLPLPREGPWKMD